VSQRSPDALQLAVGPPGRSLVLNFVQKCVINRWEAVYLCSHVGAVVSPVSAWITAHTLMGRRSRSLGALRRLAWPWASRRSVDRSATPARARVTYAARWLATGTQSQRRDKRTPHARQPAIGPTSKPPRHSHTAHGSDHWSSTIEPSAQNQHAQNSAKSEPARQDSARSEWTVFVVELGKVVGQELARRRRDLPELPSRAASAS